MKFMFFVLPTVPGTLAERAELRPIGRNVERYQEMLDQVRELATLADEAGFEVMSTTEHHFHSEGFEASTAPLLLYADLAARTERIKFGPLGLVLPAWDPLRAAEELAILDHLTKGRVYAGFARGYQDRWVNVMGQQYHVTGAPMDGSSIDDHNRAVYEEVLELIKEAWTKETVTFDGKYYKVPYPFDEGIARWPAADWTRKYGAEGEVDEEGVVRRVSVIPRPYQDPHPRLHQPFSVSEKTIIYTAANDIVAWVLGGHREKFVGLCETYKRVSGEHGRTVGLGEGIGAVRAVHFGDTREEAVKLLESTNYAGFDAYFGEFGFWEAFRMPPDDEKYPNELLPRDEWTLQRMLDVEYAIAGTTDDVKRQVSELHGLWGAEGGELEWFGWFFDQGVMPMDQARRQMELFATHIIPEFS